MSLNEIESPLTNYYVIVLPQYEYATVDENGKDIKAISNSNIFNEIIEYNKYTITHDVPKPSKKDENNIIFNLKQNNNFSALAEVQVNKTGHVYSDGKKLFNLPQAIIVSSEEELNNLDVPVGTLAYVADHIFDKLDVPVIELITENADKLDRTTIELISEIIKTKELDVPTIELLRTIINK